LRYVCLVALVSVLSVVSLAAPVLASSWAVPGGVVVRLPWGLEVYVRGVGGWLARAMRGGVEARVSGSSVASVAVFDRSYAVAGEGVGVWVVEWNGSGPVSVGGRVGVLESFVNGSSRAVYLSLKPLGPGYGVAWYVPAPGVAYASLLNGSEGVVLSVGPAGLVLFVCPVGWGFKDACYSGAFMDLHMSGSVGSLRLIGVYANGTLYNGSGIALLETPSGVVRVPLSFAGGVAGVSLNSSVLGVRVYVAGRLAASISIGHGYRVYAEPIEFSLAASPANGSVPVPFMVYGLGDRVVAGGVLEAVLSNSTGAWSVNVTVSNGSAVVRVRPLGSWVDVSPERLYSGGASPVLGDDVTVYRLGGAGGGFNVYVFEYSDWMDGREHDYIDAYVVQDGRPVKGVRVYFYIPSRGKVYTVTTDSSGLASLNVTSLLDELLSGSPGLYYGQPLPVVVAASNGTTSAVTVGYMVRWGMVEATKTEGGGYRARYVAWGPRWPTPVLLVEQLPLSWSHWNWTSAALVAPAGSWVSLGTPPGGYYGVASAAAVFPLGFAATTLEARMPARISVLSVKAVGGRVVIVGRVTGPGGGEPLEAARVYCLASYEHGGAVFTRALTNSTGYYRLVLPKGTFTAELVAVTPEGLLAGSGWGGPLYTGYYAATPTVTPSPAAPPATLLLLPVAVAVLVAGLLWLSRAVGPREAVVAGLLAAVLTALILFYFLGAA